MAGPEEVVEEYRRREPEGRERDSERRDVRIILLDIYDCAVIDTDSKKGG